MRHPAVLAKEAVSLDHASGGRFELGIGWGSVPEELVAFGVGPEAAKPRIERLAESLEVITRLWRGEPVTYDGVHHAFADAHELPTPLRTIPLIIGGSGSRTLEFVARYADWWNLPVIDLPRLDELRPNGGGARVSVQAFVTLVDDPARRDEINETARRRFGSMLDTSGITGTAEELVEQFRDLERRGVERLSTWFTDFAPPATIARFGADVIPAFETKDRSMSVRLSEDEAWSVIEGSHTGIITTLRADGSPVTLPMWFVVIERHGVLLHVRPDEEGRCGSAATRVLPSSWSRASSGSSSARCTSAGTSSRSPTTPPSSASMPPWTTSTPRFAPSARPCHRRRRRTTRPPSASTASFLSTACSPGTTRRLRLQDSSS